MKILYIPFHEENDLVLTAIRWKNTLNGKNITIIQHGKPINYHAIKDKVLTIYVLAHGLDSATEPFYLASHSKITRSTTKLDIKKIAERFNYDFVYLHTQLKNIKLYFCNNKGDQKFIAERFKNNLVLFSSPIDYYAGTITEPFKDKTKYSLFAGVWYKTSKVRNTLYNKAVLLDSNDRLSVKERSRLEYLEKAKQSRRDAVLQRQHKARQEKFTQNRHKYTEEQRLHLEETSLKIKL